ncbi:MAG TPA: hypothetical protein VF467_15955 [Afipia sp.]
MSPMSRAELFVAVAATLVLLIGSAVASQGPGIPPGTASASTQTAMAIVIYGLSAVIVIAGLIGAVKRP